MPTQTGQNLNRQLSSGSPDGTTYGDATTDPISFYGATSVAQQASTVDAITQLVNLGLLASGSTVSTGGNAPINITAAATTTIANAGKINVLASATGVNVILPAATGSGATYDFYVGVTVTTGTMALKSPASTTAFYGSAFQTSGASTATFYANGATTQIGLNGTTTGGILGDRITLKDISTGVFQVDVLSHVTGTAATPFS